MADPLSVAASVVALLQLAQTIVNGVSDIKNASKERTSIRDEVIYLSGLLFNLKGKLDREELLSGILGPLSSPSGPLDQLKQALEQLADMVPPSEGLRAVTFSWSFQKNKIEAILRRIERQKSFIVLALESDQISLSHSIRQDVADLREKFEALCDGVEEINVQNVDRKHQKRLEAARDNIQWMSPLSFLMRQRDLQAKAQSGTCQWLFERHEFKEWYERDLQLLWCCGPPGVGKTFLASMTIQHLEKSLSDDNAIAYVFCDYKDRAAQTAEHIMASLVQQLCLRHLSMSTELEELCELHRKRQTRPPLADWVDALHREIRFYAKIYLVIDALDECTESDDARHDLLTVFRALPSNVHTLITCRPSAMLVLDVDPEEIVELAGNNDDIRQYLKRRMWRERRLSRHLAADPSLGETVVKSVLASAQGMFLMARLHLDLVAQKPTKKGVLQALQSLPTNLDQSYDDTMLRVTEQVAEDVELARYVLFWIALTNRPLEVIELQHALALAPYTSASSHILAEEETHFDHQDLISEDILLSVCMGLVMVDKETSIIRLVHYTAQSYLERCAPTHFPDAQPVILRSCLAYLSLPVFSQGPCNSDKALMQRLSEYPFLSYAARYWGHHTRRVQGQEHTKLIVQFLEAEQHLLAAVQVMHLLPQKFTDSSQLFPKDATALQIAASFGLETVVNELLTRGASTSVQDENGWTALHRASENGHKNVVELLISTGADVNVVAHLGGTPLHRAAKKGHESVARILIDKACLDQKSHDEAGITNNLWYRSRERIRGNYRRHVQYESQPWPTALHQANERGLDLKDQYGATALHRAARHGHEQIVRLLLTAGADVHANPDHLQQDLADKLQPSNHYAEAEIVRSGTHVEVQNLFRQHSGGNAVHEAAGSGHAGIVKILIEAGASIDCPDSYGGTPLHRAAANGHVNVVYQLLQSGANVNMNAICNLSRTVKDRYRDSILNEFSGTPLHLAARNGHQSTIKELLKGGARLEVCDQRKQTPLSAAAAVGQTVAVKFLLESGSCVDGPDLQNPTHSSRSGDDDEVGNREAADEGLTPLHHAARQCHLDVARLLIEKAATINKQTKQGLTPLMLATVARSSVMVSVLLQEGAEPKFEDIHGQTALHWASAMGDNNLINIFLEAGLDVNTSTSAPSPLYLASKGHHFNTMQHLLDRGARIVQGVPSPEDQAWAWSALVNTCKREVEPIFTALMDQLSPETLNASYQTKLMTEAARSGSGHIMKLLLALGGDVNCPSCDWKRGSLLAVAVDNGQLDVCEVLIAQGADLEGRDRDGTTALARAITSLFRPACEQAHAIFELLLKNGANVNNTDATGYTALHIRILRPSLTEALLKAGANPNIENSYGHTALMCTTDPDNMDLLLQYGADPNFMSSKGMTALSEALAYNMRWKNDEKMNNDDTILVLLYYGARPANMSDHDGLLAWAKDFYTRGAQSRIMEPGVKTFLDQYLEHLPVPKEDTELDARLS